MSRASRSSPGRRRNDEREAARLAQAMLDRVRAAHRGQPEAARSRPVFTSQFQGRGPGEIGPVSPLAVAGAHSEALIVIVCLILCLAGMLHNSIA